MMAVQIVYAAQACMSVLAHPAIYRELVILPQLHMQLMDASMDAGAGCKAHASPRQSRIMMTLAAMRRWSPAG